MSIPSAAGYDPLFWFHHAGVDWLRRTWQHNNEQLRPWAYGYPVRSGYAYANTGLYDCSGCQACQLGFDADHFEQLGRFKGTANAADVLCGVVDTLYTYDTLIAQPATTVDASAPRPSPPPPWRAPPSPPPSPTDTAATDEGVATVAATEDADDSDGASDYAAASPWAAAIAEANASKGPSKSLVSTVLSFAFVAGAVAGYVAYRTNAMRRKKLIDVAEASLKREPDFQGYDLGVNSAAEAVFDAAYPLSKNAAPPH